MHTLLTIEGVVSPRNSGFEYTETWTNIVTGEVHQTWDGETEIVAPTFKSKYRIAIDASGSTVFRMPALDHLAVDDQVVLHSFLKKTAVIPQGADQCILLRDPVPGSVRVVDPETMEEVAFELAGKVVSIAAPAAKALAVIHRWKIVAKVLSIGDASVNARNSEMTWSLEIVEKSAPA